MNALISGDERVSSNPVARIVFGDPAAFLPHLPQRSVVHCSKMWTCRTRITVEYLQHIVEQKNGKETVPVLWKFLQKVGASPGALARFPAAPRPGSQLIRSSPRPPCLPWTACLQRGTQGWGCGVQVVVAGICKDLEGPRERLPVIQQERAG